MPCVSQGASLAASSLIRGNAAMLLRKKCVAELLPRNHYPSCSVDLLSLAEAFFGSFKRDYVCQASLDTLEAVRRQVPAWIDHYNQEVPHSALKMQSPVEFYAGWLVRNKTRPVQN